jgi:hypothetical protein
MEQIEMMDEDYEPLYRVTRITNGAVDDPDDNEFQYSDEARELYNDIFIEAQKAISEAKAKGESLDIDIAIYDTFECQNIEHEFFSTED